MTSHELARKLLEGPDVPVVLPNIESGSYTGVIKGIGVVQNMLDLDADEQIAVVSLAFEETDMETDFDEEDE